MDGHTLAETAACLDLGADEIARLALWFTTGTDEATHQQAAQRLVLDAAIDARADAPGMRMLMIDALKIIGGAE